MATPVAAKRGKKPRGTPAPSAPAGGQVQSLTRGLTLLELIANSHGSVALTELAQQAGLPNSTTHRLLTTMQQQGFVRQEGDLGYWTMGGTCVCGWQQFFTEPEPAGAGPPGAAYADGKLG